MKIQNESPWLASIGSIKGSIVEVHLTSILIIAWFCFSSWVSTDSIPLTSLTAFLCTASLLLHEAVHQIFVRNLGKTILVRLYAYGSLRFIGLDEEIDPSKKLPRKIEYKLLLASLSAPLLNLVLAITFLASANFFKNQAFTSAIYQVAEFNLVLGLINLLPVLPLDFGGFIKTIVSYKEEALDRFYKLNKILIWLLATIAFLTGYPPLLLIVVVILPHCLKEIFYHNAAKTFSNTSVKELMIDITKLDSFSKNLSTSSALLQVSKSFQSVFPVFLADELVGLVNKEDLLKSATSNEQNSLGAIMQSNIISISANDPLISAFSKCEALNAKYLIVTSEEKPVGILLKEKISEYLLISELRKKTEESLL